MLAAGVEEMKESCETCRFWKRFDAPASGGACRRRCPTVFMHYMTLNGNPLRQTDSAFPSIEASNWCGEWEVSTSVKARKDKVVPLKGKP